MSFYFCGKGELTKSRWWTDWFSFTYSEQTVFYFEFTHGCGREVNCCWELMSFSEQVSSNKKFHNGFIIEMIFICTGWREMMSKLVIKSASSFYIICMWRYHINYDTATCESEWLNSEPRKINGTPRTSIYLLDIPSSEQTHCSWLLLQNMLSYMIILCVMKYSHLNTLCRWNGWSKGDELFMHRLPAISKDHLLLSFQNGSFSFLTYLGANEIYILNVYRSG